MRITSTGVNENPYTRVTWDLFDRTDRDRNETSMARTTGFPVAIVARRMLDGTIDLEPGVHPPEDLAGNTAFVESILKDLKARNVVYRKTAT
jgi:lysine 6-dehydrogenase